MKRALKTGNVFAGPRTAAWCAGLVHGEPPAGMGRQRRQRLSLDVLVKYRFIVTHKIANYKKVKV